MTDPTEPLKISDKKEFERRQQAYNDSLLLYEVDEFWKQLLYDPTISDDSLFSKLESHPNFKRATKLAHMDNFKPISGPTFSGRKSKYGTEFNYLEHKKPTQPVEYVKPQRPSYSSIPTKTPTALPTQQATEEALRTFPVEDAYIPPKDARRFTAGNYLESQGKPSGYVNYGDNKGRKEVYQNGGIRDINNNDIGTLFNQRFGIQ